MKKYCKIIFLLLIYLGVIELTLHILMPAPRIIKLEITAGWGGRYLLSPNYKLIYVPSPNVDGFNADGYRGRMIPHERRSGATRIIFMGDSVTEGICIPTGLRFTDIMDKKLWPRYEVLNFGVPGYNLVQEVEYVKEKALPYKPDHVIMGICCNDESRDSDIHRDFDSLMGRLNDSAFYRLYYYAKNDLDNKLLVFNTYRYFKYFTNRLNSGKSESADLTEGEIREQLEKLEEMAASNNFKPSLIIFASVNGMVAKNIERIAREKGMTVIDLKSEVDKRLGAGAYIKMLRDFGHFNKYGHKVIADIVCEKYGFT